MSKILVVDDERHTLRMIEVNLRRAGYEVSTLADPRLAFERVTELCPDLIVLDFLMPHLDGGEVLDLLWQDPGLRYLPVILLCAKTASAEPWVRQMEYLRRKPVPHLVKPFSPYDLVDLVRESLQKISSDT